MAVLLIVASALLTFLTATALGGLLIERLRLPLSRQERPMFALRTRRAACLSLLVFVLCATHAYYRGVMLALALALILVGVVERRALESEVRKVCAVRQLRARLASAVHSLLLSCIWLMQWRRKPVPMARRIISASPRTTSELTDFCLSIHDDLLQSFAGCRVGLPRRVHLRTPFRGGSRASISFSSPPTAWLMICFGRRTGQTKAAIAAAFLFYASPIAGVDGSSAYIDCATAAILFTIF